MQTLPQSTATYRAHQNSQFNENEPMSQNTGCRPLGDSCAVRHPYTISEYPSLLRQNPGKKMPINERKKGREQNDTSQSLIELLRDQNAQLQMRLERERNQSQRVIRDLSDNIREKNTLLDECESEIQHMKQSYQVLMGELAQWEEWRTKSTKATLNQSSKDQESIIRTRHCLLKK